MGLISRVSSRTYRTMFGAKASSFMYVYLIAAACYVAYLLFCIYMRYCRDNKDGKAEQKSHQKRSEKTRELKTQLDKAQARIAELEARLEKQLPNDNSSEE